MGLGRSGQASLLPHYLGRSGGRGFSSGSRLDVAVTSVWLLHSRPWRKATLGARDLPGPGPQ